MFLQLKLRAANRAAAKGADAAEYAETIYDAFDDEDIHGFALDANWFKFLTEALPDCAAHEAWYSKVRLALIELALEDGILARDPTGNLTIPPEDDTNVEIAEGAANGSIDPATSAGESGGVKS